VRRLTEVKRWQRVKEIGRGGFGEVFLEKERFWRLSCCERDPKAKIRVNIN
jgi:hypothetical protein